MLSGSSKTALLACAAAALLPVENFVAAYPQLNQVQNFMSRPDLKPPKFEIITYDEEAITPGYILMTPYTPPLDTNLASGNTEIGSIIVQGPQAELNVLQTLTAESVQSGPYIFDSKGNLVYSGFGSTGAQYAHDLKLAQYDGQDVLTYWQGNDIIGRGGGHGIIMDKRYRTIQTVNSGNGRTANDEHEFTVLPGGERALTTIFQLTQYDLQDYGLMQPFGWVVQGIFQELDIASGDVVFEWKSLDHLDPSNSYNAYNSSQGGNGSTIPTNWDYFHMNSIEKDMNANYLISSRYSCALFLISAADGHIIWHLGGKQNDFEFIGFNASFAFQHDARILAQNATTTIISVFDNGSDGETDVSSASSGIIMAADISTMTVTQLNRYMLPDGGTLSTSQGNTQVLDDGNVFIGWGSEAYISEHTAAGDTVYLAQFGANNSAAMTYRALKVPSWVGTPDGTPALWTYANGTNASATAFYTSWNGATEVAGYNFYGGRARNSTALLGHAARTGFETVFVADRFVGVGYSEAVDASGASLGASPMTNTYLVGDPVARQVNASIAKRSASGSPRFRAPLGLD